MKIKAILYGLLQLTWGSLLTIPGLIGAFVAVVCGGIVHRNGFSIIIEIGGNGGGLNLGAISFCGNYSEVNTKGFEHTRRHEFGHSIQNIIFGPLQIFLVALPSVVRYGYQHIRAKKGLPNKEYDAIWFEGTATSGGTTGIKNIEG